jgi:predicted YcjX-like family ATPase
MWFFPLGGGTETRGPGSIGSLLRCRYETYKKEIRADFFDAHFRAFDRQIVLVDILGALYAGTTAFDGTSRAIRDLVTGLREGWGFWARRRRQASSDSWAVAAPGAIASTALSAVVAPHPIERVAFVATKADHVPKLSRDNLKHLLEALAKPVADELTKTRVSYHVAASIR